MKKIKVIDLLNKIASGEEVPNIILFRSTKYRFDKIDRVYRSIMGNSTLGTLNVLDLDLNDEVVIIEDTPEEIYFDEEDKLAEKEEMKKLSIEKKDNFYDYYKEDKKIEKLRIIKELDVINGWNASNCDIELATKINEIIDKVNGE